MDTSTAHPTPDATRTFISPRGVSSYLGLSPATIKRLMLHDPDPIPSYLVGRSRRVRVADLERWLERRRSKPEVDAGAIVDSILGRDLPRRS